MSARQICMLRWGSKVIQEKSECPGASVCVRDLGEQVARVPMTPIILNGDVSPYIFGRRAMTRFVIVIIRVRSKSCEVQDASLNENTTANHNAVRIPVDVVIFEFLARN